MDFSEIKINNRLEIESENQDSIMRNVKGIVIDVGKSSVIMVTDFGTLVEIQKDVILSITKINFDKIVSDSLVELKNYYTEVYDLEIKLKKLREKENDLINNLFDANFLSKFNTFGAKNRIEKSVDKNLLSFKKDIKNYKIWFEANPNKQIEIWIKVSESFEHYNSEKLDSEKIIKVYAPKEKTMIEKSFNLKGEISELEKAVVYERDSWYSVSSLYRFSVDINQENFTQVRDEIIKGLDKLRR